MSKTSLKKMCREILHRNKGSFLSGEDLDFMLSVLSCHPEWDLKTGSGYVQGISVKRESRYGTFCFYLLREDGTEVDISFNVAISGTTPRGNALSAMRTATSSNQTKFLYDNWTDGCSCELCGIPLKKNGTHIDHVIPFVSLAEAFCEERGIAIDSILVKEASDGIGCVFAREEDEAEWKAYHNNRATLRLLCKKCNLTRARTEDA